MSRDSADAARAQASDGRRARKSYYLTNAVVERLNAAVVAAKKMESQDGEYLPDSASAFVENALWQEIVRMEEQHNGGESFERVEGALPAGPSASGRARISRPRGAYYPE